MTTTAKLATATPVAAADTTTTATDDETFERKAREELKAIRKVLRAMERLSTSDRARVLLWVITKYAPNAFLDTELMSLVRRAQGPRS